MTDDRKNLKDTVRNAYASIARGSSGGCCGPADTTITAKAIGYSQGDLEAAPEQSNLGLGCGNPTALASLKEGEVVLDLGSGAGFDCFLASGRVGPGGRVIGVDMTPEMVEKANRSAVNGGFSNVEFRLGEIEKLPVPDNSVDVVISNCVINLSPQKHLVFKEIYRVLKPGGRISISDIALLKELPESFLNSLDAYVGCVSGALLVDDYRQVLAGAGLADVKVTVKTTASCLGTDTNDPLAAALADITDGIGDVADSIASVHVEALKATDA